MRNLLTGGIVFSNNSRQCLSVQRPQRFIFALWLSPINLILFLSIADCDIFDMLFISQLKCYKHSKLFVEIWAVIFNWTLKLLARKGKSLVPI